MQNSNKKWQNIFEGRVSRSEYWLRFIILALLFVVLGSLTAVAWFADAYGDDVLFANIFRIAMLCVSIAVLIFLLALVIRRLRDAGLSPLWALFLCIPTPFLSPLIFPLPLPFLGLIATTVLGFIPSKRDKS